MSALAPELEHLIAVTRDSFSPDEQALTALRAALDARLGRATEPESQSVPDAPSRVRARLTRHVLAKLVVSAVAFTAIGGGWRLWLELRHAPATPTLAHVAPPVERARATPVEAEPLPPLAAASAWPPSAAAQVARPLERPRRATRAEHRARAQPRPSPANPSQPPVPFGVPAIASQHGASEDSLARELNVLHAADTAIERGDATGAVALLDQHDRLYPTGPLRQERLATRVLALCELGRLRDAHATARLLLRVEPQALYAARLRHTCVSDLVR